MLEASLIFLGWLLRLLDKVISVARLIVYHSLVCVQNARKLIALLVLGTHTWVVMCGRLLLFTFVLGPGWYQLLKYWFFNPFILRNVEFGLGAEYRNVMDIYLPTITSEGCGTKVTHAGAPVVIFVSGGAWMIGYKLWSALMGRGLAKAGFLVVVPDYRNFPQGDIEDMMSDIRRAILWTAENISRFGGDPNKITLAGQSAGAHICMCLLTKDFLASKQPVVMSPEELLRSSVLVLNSEDETSENLNDLGEGENESDSNGEADTDGNNCLRGEGEGGNVDGGIPIDTHDGEVLNEEDRAFAVHFHLRSLGQSSEEAAGTQGTYPTPTDWPDKTSMDRWISPLHAPQLLTSQTQSSSPELGTSDWGSPGRILPTSKPTLSLSSAVLGSPATSTSNSHRQQWDGVYPEATLREDVVGVEVQSSVLPLVRMFVGVSGPYNLLSLQAHLHTRGLDASILSWICRGDLSQYSPSALLATFAARAQTAFQKRFSTLPSSSAALQEENEREETVLRDALSEFPPVALFHGSHDQSIPPSISAELAHILQSHGAHAMYSVYEGWSHTDAILEAPLLGNLRLIRDIASAVAMFTQDKDVDERRSLRSDRSKGTSGSSERRPLAPPYGDYGLLNSPAMGTTLLTATTPRKRVVVTDESPLMPRYLRRGYDWFFQSPQGAVNDKHRHSPSHHSKAAKERGEEEREPALAPRRLVKFARLINPF